MWSRDYKQEWSSSSNNKEGVGCSFVHLIYWLIRRIIKRLPSCQGRRLMAVDSGCQGVDLLWGQVWDVGILWRQKVLVSGLSSLASPVSFSLVPVYAQSLKLPPVLCLSLSFLSGRPRNNDLGACSFQGYTMGEWDKEEKTESCVMIKVPLWATGTHPTGDFDNFVEHTPELFPRKLRKPKYLPSSVIG